MGTKLPAMLLHGSCRPGLQAEKKDNTEKKAKVVAAVYHQDDIKKRINFTRMI